MMSYSESSTIPNQLAARPIPASTGRLQTVVALFKLRIVALLLFAAIGGAFLAAGGWPGAGPLMLLVLSGGSAAAGASALNQYLEQPLDSAMRRTRRRPLVTGAIARSNRIPVIALGLIFIPSLAILPLNPPLAFWSLAGAAIYVGVYTVWLKPRTVLNIVIGGAAGTCAVLSGGAAAGNWADPGVLVLGLLVFLWTPAHFWSLALLCRDDYAQGGVPMLPVGTSARQSAFWVALHAASTGFAALVLATHAALGWLYLLPAALATVAFLRRSLRLVTHPGSTQARSVFLTSNLFLAVIVLTICIAAVL